MHMFCKHIINIDKEREIPHLKYDGPNNSVHAHKEQSRVTKTDMDDCRSNTTVSATQLLIFIT